jgi:8-oxo-dGTP pyrophosphatase MutT (NUDIX family)
MITGVLIRLAGSMRDPRGVLRTKLEQAPDPVAPEGDRLAAVLLPLVLSEPASIVFTRRHSGLSRHAGEISFPGGLPHDSDADLGVTALRETWEEIGIEPASVDVLGALSPVHTTVSGILILPFVGALEHLPELRPSEAEIEEILTFSVADLVGKASEIQMEREGRRFTTHAFEMDGGTVWGATGRILREFLDVVGKEAPWLAN